MKGTKLLFIFPVALNLRAHWQQRVRAAVDAGFDVHVAVPNDGGLRDLDLGKATLHNIPERRGSPSIFGELSFFFALLRLILNLRPHILHAVTIRPVIYGGIAARLLRVPAYVASITGLGYLFIGSDARARFLRPFGECAYRLALHHRHMAAIFENENDRDLFIQRGIVDGSKTNVWIGGGIDLGHFAFQPEEKGSVSIVVLPARLLIDKGVREFAEAVRGLRPAYPDARFVLVGDVDPGNPATLTHDEVNGWVAEGIVEHWGWREDMPDIIREAAIICLPSYREGAPMALIEAASIGRAVVATDVPGCRQVVVNGETGLLVQARDAKALAEALSRLLSDRSLREAMGRAGRTRAETMFGASVAIERLLALYRSLSGKA